MSCFNAALVHYVPWLSKYILYMSLVDINDDVSCT